MSHPTLTPDLIQPLCEKMEAEQGLESLTAAINQLTPDSTFKPVLTRGNWHRLGGVVDSTHKPIAENILHWAEQVTDGDIDDLIAQYDELGYFATRIAGQTHYFTHQYGNGPDEFIQLEIEELQQVLDRPLIAPDWYPDSIDEFIDPLDYERVSPDPVGKAYYRFRRITDIAELWADTKQNSQSLKYLKRFFEDWTKSSASEYAQFSHHWVLALRESMNSDGENQISAKPVCAYTGEFPSLLVESLHNGTELANAIHNYDRCLGYPFAWYFMMLSSSAKNFALADAVLQDQIGAYDYLPQRDLKVLRTWEERPYGV